MLYISLLIVLCGSVTAQYLDYYWRDYYGVIPEDALPAGKDVNGEKVYIGQVYVDTYGITIGQISPGKTEIEVSLAIVKKQNYLIKVLCTRHPNNFYWFKSNSETYLVDTIGKNPVIGGYYHRAGEPNGVLHVGRILLDGMLKLGYIVAYNPRFSYLYFPHQNREQGTKYYEVLVYRNETNETPECSLQNVTVN